MFNIKKNSAFLLSPQFSVCVIIARACPSHFATVSEGQRVCVVSLSKFLEQCLKHGRGSINFVK